MESCFCYVNNEGVLSFFPLTRIKNKFTQDIISDFGVRSGKLCIQTPYFRKELDQKDIPFKLYPELGLSINQNKNEKPLYFLINSQGGFYIIVHVQYQSNEEIPEALIEIDIKSFSRLKCDSFYEYLKREIWFPTIDGRIYIDEEEVLKHQAFSKYSKRLDHSRIKFVIEPNEEINKSIRHRINIIREITSTEQSYIKSLTTLIEFWQVECMKAHIFNESEQQLIFKDIYTIKKCHEMFLENIIEKGTNYHSQVGVVFSNFSQFFRVSKPYISTYPQILSIVQEKSLNPKFSKILADLSVKCNGLQLVSYLITPIQRIPRYILFLKDLVKSTPKWHPDFPNLSNALRSIQRVTDDIESATSAAEKLAEMYRLHNSLNGFPLLKGGRSMVAKHDVLISKTKGLIIIFNDIIIIAKEIKSGYSVLSSCNLDSFRYEFVSDNQQSINAISIKDNIIFSSRDNMNACATKIDSMVLVTGPNEAFRWNRLSIELPLIEKPSLTFYKDLLYGIFSANSSLNMIIFSQDLSSKTVQRIPITQYSDYQIVFVKNISYVITYDPCIIWDGDILTNQWRQIHNPPPMFKGSSFQSSSSKLYLFGGQSQDGIYSNMVFNTSHSLTQKWELINTINPPSPRKNASSSLVNDFLVVFGGCNDKSQFFDAHILNLMTKSWFNVQIPILPSSSILTYNNQFIVFNDKAILLSTNGSTKEYPSISTQPPNQLTSYTQINNTLYSLKNSTLYRINTPFPPNQTESKTLRYFIAILSIIIMFQIIKRLF